MPRRAYVADLQKLQDSTSIPGVVDVKPGNDDGEFVLKLAPNSGVAPFEISALIPDLGDYPSDHTYHVFVVDDSAPAFIGQTLEYLPSTAGKTLQQLVEILVATFNGGVDKDGDHSMPDSQYEGSDDDSEQGYDSDEVFDLDGNAQMTSQSNSTVLRNTSLSDAKFRERVRSDLNIVKAAGFRVGCHGALLEGGGCYLSISIRVRKLGISDEALEAWQLGGDQYLVLLIHYPNGYKTLDDVSSYDTTQARRNIDFRVGCCGVYKPTISETIKAFAQLTKEKHEESTQVYAADDSSYRDVFISQPLNQLLRERLPTILRYRYQGMGWTASENYFNDYQGKNVAHSQADALDDSYEIVESTTRPFPALVIADHISENLAPHSLPLASMQFLLRHFVRCTEFCLVCHCKLPDDFEAIKPYVCEKPLCLYQYMSLGFGPSIEHEITWQPYVVDLLVSFCYVSARSQKLKSFPTGLSLSVPHLSIVPPVRKSTNESSDNQALSAKYDPVAGELLFEKNKTCPVRAGDWIQFVFQGHQDHVMHARVKDTTYYPTVALAEPITIPQVPAVAQSYQTPNPIGSTATTSKSAAPIASTSVQLLEKSGFRDILFNIYNRNFDLLQDHEKHEAIVHVLSTLPRVLEMKSYLASHKDTALSSWIDRLSPAAVGVLRWIIASNRACIMQSKASGDVKASKFDDRVYGMKGWMQFRFAMGAPDKERRFAQAVGSTKTRLGLKIPSLYAWHGSPLHNWHGIIREGLHFNTVAHGRAFGDGVYHSLHFNTSAGYSAYYTGSYRGYGDTTGSTWPATELSINSAVSLNEIVNAPKEFVSHNPHLVVAQLDWIQTRYLFVKCTGMEIEEVPIPTQCLEQDSSMTPMGETSKIKIPAAVALRNKPSNIRNMISVSNAAEALKAKGTAPNPIFIDDDAASVATDIEDYNLLLGEDEAPVQAPTTAGSGLTSTTTKKGGLFDGLKKAFGSKSSKANGAPLTDFVPGSLSYDGLPLLQEPQWASPIATRRLQKDFQAIVAIQGKTPMHELGWYTNPEKFDNVYQWIVELHSFDEKLPLAKQMKAKGITSVVMEMRFGADYPMSPPFIRIIRPRFLGFQAGGGGHVTAGGSLCMELLTNSGWSAVSSIEAVLLQVRMAITSTDPRPAQLESSNHRGEYGIAEAVDAYIRACNVHGWTVPPGFKQLAWGGQE